MEPDESWLELLQIENQSGHKNYPSIHWADDIQYWYLPLPATACSCPDYNFPLYIDDQFQIVPDSSRLSWAQVSQPEQD